ncbi:MAG: ribose-phosphate pyrophosphokinase [Oscillospiraceae bacterium]|nr:ribose-phosphate pyrophosphokinase [Oscillospiraceae bacterium]
MKTVKNTEVLYKEYNEIAPIGLIAMRGTEALAARINNYLIRWADRNGCQHREFMIDSQCPRFASGDAKGLIKNTVRGKDLFILVDVGNYSCTYKLFDRENYMSPDDHYADLKRIIQAASGKPHRINVIMPLLYGGRQHRRSYRESLDCAFMLQELQQMGVQNVITVDAHDPRVCNAIPLMGFDNVIPSYQVLKAMFGAFPDLVIDKDSFMVISPDEGALNRNMFYASVLEVEMGMFYKRRDYSTIVNGRNPIVAHEYLGTSVEGKTVFVADDIISSGESMLDIAQELKKRKAKRFFAYATYGIFTNGLAEFDKAYENGMIDAVFSTNLTYRTPELMKRPWYKEVDVSKYIAYFIASINHETSISNVIDPHEKIKTLLREHKGL